MKNKQSTLLNSFIKIAKEKKLIKEEPVKLLDLKVSNNLMDNMLKLCNGLRAKGFNSYADELESNYLLYSAASNSYESDGAKKLINEAHPDGSLEYKDVDGEAIFHTVLDTQVKMLDVVSKTPKVKNAKLIQEVKKVFGQLTENLYDQKNVTNVVDTLLQGGAGNLIKDVSNTLQNLTPEQKEILKRRQSTAPTAAPKPENKPVISLTDKLLSDYDSARTRIARFKAIVKANGMQNSVQLNTFLDQIDVFLKTNKDEFSSNAFKDDQKVRDPYLKKLNDVKVRLDAFEARWLK